jgi:PAS domain S-box-containing protein
MLDKERNIVSCNQAFLNLFGFEEDEVKGKSIRIIHRSDESFRGLGEKIGASTKTTGAFRSEWELIHKDGKVIPVEGAISIVKARDGLTSGYVAILRDITRRRKTEGELEKYRDHLESMVIERTQELEAAQKALIQKEKLKTLVALSSEIAHEIRNPLTSIGGFARRLKKKAPDGPEAAIILEESMRLEKLLNRIIDYLQPVEIRLGKCSVNEILGQCLDLLSSELASERIFPELDLDPELPAAYVDPAVLTEVFINVVRNAIKSMGGTGTIAIKTFPDDQNIHITFQNLTSGTKIKDPELMLLPFEGERPNIGMPICFRLLEDMDGILSCTQEEDSMLVSITLLKYLNTNQAPQRKFGRPDGGGSERMDLSA